MSCQCQECDTRLLQVFLSTITFSCNNCTLCSWRGKWSNPFKPLLFLLSLRYIADLYSLHIHNFLYTYNMETFCHRSTHSRSSQRSLQNIPMLGVSKYNSHMVKNCYFFTKEHSYFPALNKTCVPMYLDYTYITFYIIKILKIRYIN